MLEHRTKQMGEAYACKYDYLLSCFIKYKEQINERGIKASKENADEVKELLIQVEELKDEAEAKRR